MWGECYDIEETTSLVLYGPDIIGEIPNEIGNLINLQQLHLGNRLTRGIPFEIGDLENLTSLKLDYNQLGCYNYDFDENICLTYCNDTNECSGEIPSSIGNLTNLTNLELELNHLDGEIPSEIGNLTNLEWLYLNDNQLTGEIPSINRKPDKFMVFEFIF